MIPTDPRELDDPLTWCRECTESLTMCLCEPCLWCSRLATPDEYPYCSVQCGIDAAGDNKP